MIRLPKPSKTDIEKQLKKKLIEKIIEGNNNMVKKEDKPVKSKKSESGLDRRNRTKEHFQNTISGTENIPEMSGYASSDIPHQ